MTEVPARGPVSPVYVIGGFLGDPSMGVGRVIGLPNAAAAADALLLVASLVRMSGMMLGCVKPAAK